MKGEKNTQTAKHKLINIIQTDPHLATIIWDLNLIGIREITYNGTTIVVYYNEKTNIELVIDPAHSNITFRNNNTGEILNIHPRTALKFLKETYGIPKIMEIPKFGTNIPELTHAFNNLKLKNVLLPQNIHHPQENPES